jgi:hypothetical protein
METSPSTGSGRDMAAFFLFTVGMIFIGPLEAIAGLAAYALFSSSKQPDTESRP